MMFPPVHRTAGASSPDFPMPTDRVDSEKADYADPVNTASKDGRSPFFIMPSASRFVLRNTVSITTGICLIYELVKFKTEQI